MSRKEENRDLWDRILMDLEARGHAGGYGVEFISELSLIEDTGSKFIIEYPRGQMIAWLEMNYREYMEMSIASVMGTPRELQFVEAGEQSAAIEAALNEQKPATTEQKKEEEQPQAESSAPAANEETPAAPPPRTKKRTKEDTKLNEAYTFENMVVGPNNDFAYTTAQALIHSEQRMFNPLFIHGASGLGKTHLMHAIGHAIRARRPEVVVQYVTCEEFTNSYIEAVRKKGDALNNFRRKFRKADVLMIDDVQFMARTEKTQEEFFHTFNALFDSGKQIILSADCPASHITNMDSRLVTRFQQGMAVELTAPSYETRVEILRQKMQRWEKQVLSEEIVHFLARSITSSVRSLEGGLVRASAYAVLHNSSPSIAFLRENLGDLMTTPRTSYLFNTVSIEDIQQRVAEEFHLCTSDINGPRRTAAIAHPRQVAMYLARKHTCNSLQDIGAAFGGRDHGTVLHATRTIENKMLKDPALRGLLERFSAALA